MKELNIDEDEVEVFNDEDGYSRQEFWTNGEWFRLGRDVTTPRMDGGRFIEIKFEVLSEFYDKLRSQSGVGKHTLDDFAGSNRTYITDAGYSLDVYSDRKHILYHSDHEYGIFRTAMKRASDKRETFDYEQLTESFAESIIPSFWEVRSVTERGNVEVYSPTNTVKFDFINDLRDSEYVVTESRKYPVNVYACEDGMKYSFEVKRAELPGAPDE